MSQISLLDANGLVPQSSLPRDVRPHGARGLVCFTYDDGYPMWNAIADRASELGQRHTFCVTTNRIGTVDGGFTASDVGSWHARGHEVASHSVTHGGTTPAECDASNATLEGIVGAGGVSTYAYPFGNRSVVSDQYCYGRYDRVLDYQAPSVTSMEDRAGVFHVPRVKMAAATLQQFVRLAAAQPVVVVFAGHAPGGTIMGGSADPISLPLLFETMQLAHDLGVPCVTAAEAFPGGSMLMNPSFETPGVSGGVGVWGGFGGGMAIVADTPDANLSGSQVLSIAIDNTTGSAGRQILNVQPGRSYTLSGRARLSSGTLTTGHIRARLVASPSYVGPAGTLSSFNDAGTELATTADVTTTAWSRFEVTAVAPAGCRFMEVQLVVEGQAGIAGRFDHIHFGPTHLGSFG